MSKSRDDFLKAIYEQGGAEQHVGNKSIAAHLGIAPASVTEMLGRLHKQGLIEYTPYKGSMLTQDGLCACLRIVRSHRLWEVFLIEHLGYTWSEAHEEAHLLEHATPARMAERLDAFLGHPDHCPHGSAIPQANGTVPHEALAPLSELEPGQGAVVCRVFEVADLLDYVQSVGLQIGDEIRLLEIGAYGGPLTLQTNDGTIQLSPKAAEQILVRYA